MKEGKMACRKNFIAVGLALLTVSASLFMSSKPARASYPIDCAILLCLAGGFPASVECAAAEAEFIRRITPFPIEPPLQIWRCPMGIAYHPKEKGGMTEILRSISNSLRQTDMSSGMPSLQSTRFDRRSDPIRILQIAATEGADIDISDPAFDYVRAIKVYDVTFSRSLSGRDERCVTRASRLNFGSYGAQGEFSWRHAAITQFPDWMTSSLRKNLPYCNWRGSVRAVGVEWSDYKGNRQYKVVNY